MVSQLELEREANIKRNKALLESLGLSKPLIPKKVVPEPVKRASKKRKAPVEKDATDATDEGERPAKARRVSETIDDASGGPNRRRSARNVGKAVDYKAELIVKASARRTASTPERSQRSESRVVAMGEDKEGRLGNKLGKRLHNPKTYGSIPGVPVGTWWETRAECSTDAIHAPFVAGIAGSAQDGAYSVALSGGYADDVDLGYAFTYTGSGGRDLKGTKQNPKNLRTAPQSCDQTFDNPMNRALQRSSETRKPVRVIRGFKLPSPFAPASGYRYDGLYIVERAWMERGLNDRGYQVCKYAFKRIDGQPPIPERSTEDDESECDSDQDPTDSNDSSNEEESQEESDTAEEESEDQAT